MKKITFILTLLISTYGFAQTVSTGQVALTSGCTVQFDVTSTEVTMTMVLPENDWLAVALDATGMGSTNKDVVVYDSSGLQDRYLNGQVIPPTDGASNQDWTQSSNTVTSGVRTVVATRDLNTSDAKDYVFTTTNNTALALLWARGAGTFGYHGANKGSAASTLGTATIALAPEFDVYPNPADLELNVEFPASIQKATIAVYSVLGTLVFQAEMDQWNSKINTSEWSAGVFIMNISTADFSQTKRIIKK
ncbi:T9SS type A sorting domain-containing protein [Flavobacteriaceae bacterium]|nr:T9SS type A sorting domain-containing protein [Flavobacteriaceae bacterium]